MAVVFSELFAGWPPYPGTMLDAPFVSRRCGITLVRPPWQRSIRIEAPTSPQATCFSRTLIAEMRCSLAARCVSRSTVVVDCATLCDPAESLQVAILGLAMGPVL